MVHGQIRIPLDSHILTTQTDKLISNNKNTSPAIELRISFFYVSFTFLTNLKIGCRSQCGFTEPVEQLTETKEHQVTSPKILSKSNPFSLPSLVSFLYIPSNTSPGQLLKSRKLRIPIRKSRSKPLHPRRQHYLRR